MGFDKKSDFARNKSVKEIIYSFRNGDVSLLELKDGLVYEHFRCAKDSTNNYSRIDRTITEEQFIDLKIFSNGEYKAIDRKNVSESKKIVSIHNLEETLKISIPSHEDAVIEKDNPATELENYRTMNNAMEILEKLLTPIQKRRFIANVKLELSTHKIAKIEGVAQRSVYESIESANKKIKKFLENSSKYPLKMQKKDDR